MRRIRARSPTASRSRSSTAASPPRWRRSTRERFAARLAAGDYEIALVEVRVLAARPALAAGQIAFATRGAAASRRAMAALAGLEGGEAAAAAERVARELDLVPLVATAARTSTGPGLRGIAAGPDGLVDPGALWRLGAEVHAP